MYRQKALFGGSEVFLDPNKLSEDGTTAVRDQCFTHDGSILAYGISEKGSDWMTIKVKSPQFYKSNSVMWKHILSMLILI